LAAASKCKKGTLRYWLSAGPGNFLLSPAGCPTSAFYAVVIDEDFSQRKEGVKVITSTIPMKSPMFATMKNVNYLPNVLSVMEAEDQGAFASIWIDEEGYIAEGPNVNVAFISQDKELILPIFDKILSGRTALRLLQLAPKLIEQGRLKSVKTGNLTVEEAKGAAEMMYVGSTLPILPIVMWDEQPIGDGNTTILFTFFFFFWLMEAFYLDALYSQHIILYYIIFSPRVSCLLKVCLERLNFPYHWCIEYILIYAAIIV
jgi:4-amino-4-deoxychorismate lyase